MRMRVFLLARAGALVRRWRSMLYPELRRIPSRHWAQALDRARQAELSLSERLGVLAAIGITAWALEPFADPSAPLVVRYIEQFMLALPVFALLASPWLLRRTRRGLQRFAGSFHGDEPCPPEEKAATRTDPSTAKPQRAIARRRLS